MSALTDYSILVSNFAHIRHGRLVRLVSNNYSNLKNKNTLVGF